MFKKFDIIATKSNTKEQAPLSIPIRKLVIPKSVFVIGLSLILIIGGA
ncbi:MAG TPA: hypothetical protein P5241_00805 [Candidatus Paceibacterota bacterium]|nr:hypothetical protein [Candidatus Paceibacterota bacterium]